MIAILKYNAGNIKSVKNALTRLGYDSIITDDPHELINADKVIFPGVGEASSAMLYLKERGLDKTIIFTKTTCTWNLSGLAIDVPAFGRR